MNHVRESEPVNKMELILIRKHDSHKSTVGHLYIDGKLFCATLEDTFRHNKIKNETRIPAGHYKIELRKDSPKARRYQTNYGTNGMLWLKGVPDFEYIYIHIGNDEDDSSGCVLVGSIIQESIKAGKIDLKILDSTNTYKELWSMVAPEIENNQPVYINVIDN